MKNTEKIITLAKELMAECEAQGFSTNGLKVKHISLWNHGDGVSIDNPSAKWEISEDGRVIMW